MISNIRFLFVFECHQYIWHVCGSGHACWVGARVHAQDSSLVHIYISCCLLGSRFKLFFLGSTVVYSTVSKQVHEASAHTSRRQVTLPQSIHVHMRGHVLGIGTRACVSSTHTIVQFHLGIRIKVNLSVYSFGCTIHSQFVEHRSQITISKHGSGAQLQRSRKLQASPTR